MKRIQDGYSSLGAWATIIYGTLIAVGVAWMTLLVNEPVLGRLLDDRRIRLDLILGLGIGLLVPLLSRTLVRWVDVFRFLEEEMGRWLGPSSATTAARLAILSGVGEEVFFRGALQPEIGWFWTTLVFAVMHVGPDRRFLAWTGISAVLGGLLGWMALHTGNLLAPMIAHVTINYLGLLRIGARLEANRAAHDLTAVVP